MYPTYTDWCKTEVVRLIRESIEMTNTIPTVATVGRVLEVDYGICLNDDKLEALRDAGCRKYMTDVLGMEVTGW